MTFVMTEKTHETFLKNLDRSQIGVQWAANWLISHGYPTKILEHTTAKNPGERIENQDHGDLQVLWKGKQRRVEVKWLTCNFTGSDDWPFTYKTGMEFMVCAKHSYDNAKEKPYAYIILSADCKGIAMVMGSTRPTWWTTKNSGGKEYKNYKQIFYYCPLKEVFWYKEDTMPINEDRNPGSDAAVAAGCECPIIDNGHGQGAMGGTILDDNGQPMFWINEHCPLHGKEAHEKQSSTN